MNGIDGSDGGERMKAGTVLVGNGAGLMGLGLGAVIDSFQWVVRFNDAAPAGEAVRDLGSRTDQRVINRAWWGKVRSGHEKVPRLVVVSPAEFAQYFHQAMGPFLVDRSTLEQAAARAKCESGRQHASAGLVALEVFAERQGARNVWVAGFDGGESGHYGAEEWVHSPRHNWAGEREALAWWCRQGVRRLEEWDGLKTTNGTNETNGKDE